MGTEARARLALLGVISVSLLSYGQIFKSSEYVGPAFLGIGLAAILTLVWRRLGLGTKTTLLVMAAALLWYLVLIFQAEHSLYGLPTPEALERLAASVDHAYDRIRIDYEPVPVRSGYAVMMVVGVWLATVIGEVAAFRWRRPLLASSPALGLFCVAIVVSDRDHAAFLIMLFLSALLTYWALASSNSLRSWGRWISTWSDDEGYAASLTGSLARGMGASCVAVALVAPLILPALDEGLLPWRTGGGDGPGGAGGGRIDHLVSIKPALLEQSSMELFRVRADRAAYWRLVTLTEFDGEAWWPRGSPTVSVGGGIINAPDVVYETSVDVAQDYRITGLRDEFLPAAVAPATISFDESTDALGRTEYNALTGDLGFEGGIEPPLLYSVLSYLPDISYRELTDARIASGPDAPEYTVLPDDLAPEVERLARAWTRNAKSPAAKLIAIQNRLRDFTYSLDVEPEDSGDYLLDFLTRTRTGYCQQFATAFAVLARSLGFPARVSVGFLPGETSPATPDVYTVRGTDAHAWPEVAFENVGWVAFEPTPRGEAPPPTHTLSNRVPSIGATEGTLPSGVIQELLARERAGIDSRAPQSFEQGPERPAPGPPAWTKAFTRLALTLTGMVLAFLVCVPIVKSWRTRRRYRRARTPGAIAAAAFAHFADEAGELTSRRVPSESPRAYVTRIATARKVGRNDALRLASIYEAAAYAAWEVSQQHADEARKLAARLRSRLWTSASWWERAGRLFSPAGLRTSASRL
jgi:transglutaminase-like putative cysteine protease